MDIGTSALLDEIRKELVSVASMVVGEIIDKKSVDKIKNRFMQDAKKLLKEKIPSIKEETQDFLIGILRSAIDLGSAGISMSIFLGPIVPLGKLKPSTVSS